MWRLLLRVNQKLFIAIPVMPAWYVKYTDRIFGSAFPAVAAALTTEAAGPVVAMDRQQPES